MKIKHLLLTLLIMLANIYFMPIYQHGYKIRTFDPNILDNFFNKAYVGLFIAYIILFFALIILFILHFFIEKEAIDGNSSANKYFRSKIYTVTKTKSIIPYVYKDSTVTNVGYYYTN